MNFNTTELSVLIEACNDAADSFWQAADDARKRGPSARDTVLSYERREVTAKALATRFERELQEQQDLEDKASQFRGGGGRHYGR